VRLAAATALLLLCAFADAGPDIPALLEQMRDEDPELRAAAREGLRDAGDEAVAALKRLAVEGVVPYRAQATTLLSQIEFDKAVAKAVEGGDSWYKWERRGAVAWVKLSARRRDDRGWTLTETLHKDDAVLVTVAQADRDLLVSSVESTLTAEGRSAKTTATFDGEQCVWTDSGGTHEWPARGPVYTDWTLVRFATALHRLPPMSEDFVVWDSTDCEPATTKLHFEEDRVSDGPLDGRRATPIRVEGMLTTWLLKGEFSHTTRGEGSYVTRAKEDDVPKAVKTR
jgi:hypothetical protein